MENTFRFSPVGRKRGYASKRINDVCIWPVLMTQFGWYLVASIVRAGALRVYSRRPGLCLRMSALPQSCVYNSLPLNAPARSCHTSSRPRALNARGYLLACTARWPVPATTICAVVCALCGCVCVASPESSSLGAVVLRRRTCFDVL